MADHLLVEVGRGPHWDPARGRREQSGWDDHATFMDALVTEGVVVLGGPVGDVDGERVLLVVEASDEAEIRTRLGEDPWYGTVLAIERVSPWHVWLRRPAT